MISPRAPAARHEPPDTAAAEASLAFARPKPGVLLVDDEPKNLLALVELLRDFDIELVQSSSGEDALRWLLRRDFALMLLDVQMPRLDGYQVADMVRRRERSRGMPIIFLSAFNKDDEHVSKGYSAGAVDYVFKPINPVILRSKVQVFVELYRKTEEVRIQAEYERRLQEENLRFRAEKLAAEQKLRKIEERQAVIVQSLPIVLYSSRLGSGFSGPRFLSPQTAEAVQMPAEDFVGDPGLWPARIHHGDRVRVMAEVARVGRAGSFAMEYRWVCPDGSERWFLDQGTVGPAQPGEPLEILGSCLDITERRKIEQQLFQSQKMDAVGKLTGGIAHDFNNMLTVVIGNLELLSRNRDLNEKHRERIKTALGGASSCAELTRRLLAFSSQQPLQPEVVDLAELLTGTSKLLQQTIGEQITIAVDSAPDLWPVLVDRVQVEAAILNLALNARDAMPNGGALTLSLANVNVNAATAAARADATPGDYVEIAVADNGHGMDEATLARALEPFFSTKPLGKGTGLGLSMTYGFVRQSGGHIAIASELGRGTTVRLFLPRTDAAPMSAGREEIDVSDDRFDCTVLLVEDDAGVRRFARALLEARGCRVIEAGHAALALGILERDGAVDLLLTDVVMPGSMNGLDLGREVGRRFPQTRVLYTSGYAEALTAHPEQAGRLLHKPFREVDLVRAIAEVLREPVAAA